MTGVREHRTKGVLTANFSLLVADAELLTLRGIKAEFENGHLSFRVDPSKIEVPAVIRFLTNLLSTATPGDAGGLGVELVYDGGSLPVGVRAVVGLALPTLAFGAFSVTNLALRSYLEIALRTSGFSVAAGLSLSSRERPFQIAILFLGGGGWFDIGVRYLVGGKATPRLSIGLAAGASLQFDIGIASGGASCLVDLGVDWTGGNPLSIILGITLRGELQILGLISVSLVLRLEAEYRSNGSLFARGRLILKIKICWFIKIDVNVGFEFVLAAGSRRSLVLALDGTDPIDEYLAIFGGVL